MYEEGLQVCNFPDKPSKANLEVVQAVGELMRPMFETMMHYGKSMEQMAQAMQIMSARMEEQERIQRLSTPLTSAQERHLTAAIRERAIRLQARYSLPEEARRAYAAALRKMLCRRYGINAVRAVPACEYAVALEAVEGWDGIEVTEKYI